MSRKKRGREGGESAPAGAPKRPMGRRPKEAGGGAETRAAILDAAMELFAARGFDGTSVKSIAARADVSTGLLFHYFGSKKGLLAALIDERSAMQDVIAAIDEIARGDGRLPADELLKRVGRSIYAMARHSVPMLGVMMHEILQREDLWSHWNASREDEFNVLARALSESTVTRIDPPASLAISRTFLNTVLFEAHFGPETDVDALIAGIVRTIALPDRNEGDAQAAT